MGIKRRDGDQPVLSSSDNVQHIEITFKLPALKTTSNVQVSTPYDTFERVNGKIGDVICLAVTTPSL